jgi:hypothetical protein
MNEQHAAWEKEWRKRSTEAVSAVKRLVEIQAEIRKDPSFSEPMRKMIDQLDLPRVYGTLREARLASIFAPRSSENSN